jgi:hypothetical protein
MEISSSALNKKGAALKGGDGRCENGWKMAGKWLEKPEHLCCVFDDFLLCSCSHLFRDAVKSPFFSRRPGSSPRFEV